MHSPFGGTRHCRFAIIGEMNTTRDQFRDREDALRASAAEDLPMMALLEEATRLLAAVIERTPIPPAEGDRTADQLQHHALWFMGVISFRAARAAIQAIAAGYEDQAIGFQRLVDETFNGAKKVVTDQSGEYAKAWLDGKAPGKGAKLTGQNFWEFLSGPVHSNVRAVYDWLAISESNGATRIVLAPERRPDLSNPMLVYLAGEIRDLANVLAAKCGIGVKHTDLDAAILSAYETYLDQGDEDAAAAEKATSES
jgi:hypothetical protein